MAGITIVYHQGYFHQEFDLRGNQSEEPEPWRTDQRLEAIEPRLSVMIEGEWYR